MNYTQHYQLPVWAQSDRVLMDDFNGITGTVDEALGRLDRAARNAAYYTGRLAAQSLWKNNVNVPSHHLLCQIFLYTADLTFTGGVTVQDQNLVLTGAGKTGTMLSPNWALQDAQWTQARMWVHHSAGNVTPTLNGQTMQGVTAAYTASVRGEMCYEQEFVWNGTGSLSAQIGLTLSTGTNDSMRVYDFYIAFL